MCGLISTEIEELLMFKLKKLAIIVKLRLNRSAIVSCFFKFTNDSNEDVITMERFAAFKDAERALL